MLKLKWIDLKEVPVLDATSLVSKTCSAVKPLKEDLERRDVLLTYVTNHLERLKDSGIVVSSLPSVFESGSLVRYNRFSEPEIVRINKLDLLLSKINCTEANLRPVLANRESPVCISLKHQAYEIVNLHFSRFCKNADFMEGFRLNIIGSLVPTLGFVGKAVAFKKVCTIILLHNFVLEAGLIEDLRISSDFLLRDINGHLSISNAINFALNNPVLAVKVSEVSKVPIPFSITAESLLALPEIPKLPEPTLSVKVTDQKFWRSTRKGLKLLLKALF